VSLQVAPGELVVLQGLNGAGKSTLLKSVMGLEVRTEGRIRYRDPAGPQGAGLAAIERWDTHRRAQAGLGYVAEDRRLFTELTVRENLRIAAGRDMAAQEARALDLFPALKAMLGRRAAQMSGGEQQMLAIARTLMTGRASCCSMSPARALPPCWWNPSAMRCWRCGGKAWACWWPSKTSCSLPAPTGWFCWLRVKSGVRDERPASFPLFFPLSFFLILPFPSEGPPMSDTTTTPSGLQYEDTVLGTGAIAKAGQHVKVHYTGWLYNDGVQGAKFDSSKDRGQPFEFSLGAGQVIRGWDEGVQGMSVGGTRRLIIPAELGYGARGAGGVIPPNATLLFEVDFLGT
jgi:FKBP-type peptidyl-prolyl cis-trans isomerase FkpA